MGNHTAAGDPASGASHGAALPVDTGRRACGDRAAPAPAPAAVGDRGSRRLNRQVSASSGTWATRTRVRVRVCVCVKERRGQGQAARWHTARWPTPPRVTHVDAGCEAPRAHERKNAPAAHAEAATATEAGVRNASYSRRAQCTQGKCTQGKGGVANLIGTRASLGSCGHHRRHPTPRQRVGVDRVEGQVGQAAQRSLHNLHAVSTSRRSERGRLRGCLTPRGWTPRPGGASRACEPSAATGA